ncbi:unnamed protein product [Vicia faba]|uniref:Uncharacterized protein n=1 Tax=Vicia faba TaxID=3906 RepID=A0AAV1AAY4_VICFA|nr:unnamed protein product [Vicia faba]
MTLIESTPDAGTGALIRQDPLLMPDPEPLFSKCYKFENGRDPRGHPSPLDLFKPWSMAAAVGVAELAKPVTPRRIEAQIPDIKIQGIPDSRREGKRMPSLIEGAIRGISDLLVHSLRHLLDRGA